MKLRVREAKARWRELRASGVPENSQTREMVVLRTYLLAIGCWRVVYEEDGECQHSGLIENPER